MDKLREDTRERNWEDYVEAAGAVLAVGAGAALFLRNGGARKISNAATYMRKLHGDLIEEFADHPVDSFAEMGNIMRRNFSNAYQRAMQELPKERGYIDPSRNGVIKEIMEGIAFDDTTKAVNQLKANHLVAQRKALASNVLGTIQDFNLKNAPEHVLDEGEVNVLEHLVEKMATPLKGIADEDIAAYAESATKDERSFEKVVEYARAIQEELKQNADRNTVDITGPWSFKEREFLGFSDEGVARFGKTFRETQVDAQAWTDAIKKELLNYQAIVERQKESKTAINAIEDRLYGRKATIGDMMQRYERGDSDVLPYFNPDNKWIIQSVDANEEAITESVNVMQRLRAHRETLDDTARAMFDQIELDEIRIQNGQLYSANAIVEAKQRLFQNLGQTLPGKIFRLNDIVYNNNLPVSQFFPAGTRDLALAKALGEEGLTTSSSIFWHAGRSYKLGADNTLEEIKALRDFTLQSSQYGAQASMYKIISGSSSRPAVQRGIDGAGIFTELVDEQFGNNFDYFFGQFKNPLRDAAIFAQHKDVWAKSILTNRSERMLGTMDRYITSDSMDRKAYKGFQSWYNSRKKANDPNTIIDSILDQLVKLTGADKDKALHEFMGQSSSLQSSPNYQNPQLRRLMNDYWANVSGASKQGIVRADQYKLHSATAFKTQDMLENVQQELTKELFMQLNVDPNYGADAIESMINSSLSGERARNIKNLAGFALFEKRIERNVKGQSKTKTAENVVNYFKDVALSKPNKEDELIMGSLENVAQRFNFSDEAARKIPGGEIYHNVGNYHYVHKAYGFTKQSQSALNLIAQKNADIRMAAREFFKPITQFVSGTDALDAWSALSYIPYHIMNRVDDQLSYTKRIFGRDVTVNLGLQAQHKGSAASILTNLVLRRVAPVAIAFNALDYTDDFTRYFTGTGLAEAGASGLANSYLGIKKFTGLVGIDNALKSLTSDNAMLQYWSGITGAEHSEWNTYEEQKDYYERGYTAIRANRGWWFGSSNEIRGNRIQYWEPNTLRTLKSNYYMESMYEGSMWKKWSHSLMPTPTNPLSPLFYLFDPYYLEKQHSEDRPYPISGSTFAENTPWGIALNPIFDNFVKPRKQLHRDRLGSDGVDVKALIAHVNSEIKRRAANNQNDDIIYLQNGKLRSMLFTAFNAPTPSERIVASQGAAVTMSTEYGQYGAGITPGEYETLMTPGHGLPMEEGMDGIEAADSTSDLLTGEKETALGTGAVMNRERLNVTDRLVISAGKGNPIASQLVSTLKQNGVFGALRGANYQIMQHGALRKDQGFFYENKMRYESSTIDDMLANSETVADLLTAGKGHDYIKEMQVSARTITGLYGYLASLATGMGENNQKRIATSANMESFSRKFWGYSLGGADVPGSDVMEIARRFIPEYRRQAMVNPLMNTMPDWIPERFRFGDPYASLVNGEARLPGRGYESLNQLHPDIFGERYGAFDRFKILADIAPYSPEYKFWKKVASATIQDPRLKEEIQEIKDRVAEQTKGHDFRDYKYVGRNMDMQHVTISEILENGKFRVNGQSQIYKLSGVRVGAGPNGESTKDQLSKYMYVGQEVNLYTDENMYYAQNRDKDKTINAGVEADGMNIAEAMLKAGDAKIRKGDQSAPSYMLNHGATVNLLNTAAEFVAHADIPVWHSRIMKVETPLESYRDDVLYGTSYQNWSDVWGAYIRPNFQKFASDPTWMGIGIAAEIIDNNFKDRGLYPSVIKNFLKEKFNYTLEVGPGKKWLANKAAYILNRGQLTGQLIGHTLTMGASNAVTKTEFARGVGSMAALTFAAAANPDNLLIQTMSMSRIGWKAAEMIEDKMKSKAALVGAALGAIRWAANQKYLPQLISAGPFDWVRDWLPAENDLANTYVPDHVRKRWDMQDYFDRLTYLKYMGLYEQAADKAESEEGVNVRAIINAQEAERAEIRAEKDELHQQMNDLMDKTDPEAEAAKTLIRRKLTKMTGTKLAMRGGEWTKSAIMYKNAADATMYGLKEDAVMADVVRALPRTERDYFIEFMKEKDPEKREEILKTVSPLLNRALRTMWKMPLPEKVSNEEYFKYHTLPAPTWAGWRPNIDLANVEAKVIYNQGMQYSDMGIYASEYRKPEVQNAPNIEFNTSVNNILMTKLKLQAAITGFGIDADEVSVEPSQDSTIQVVANVARIIPYKIKTEVDNIFSQI